MEIGETQGGEERKNNVRRDAVADLKPDKGKRHKALGPVRLGLPGLACYGPIGY